MKAYDEVAHEFKDVPAQPCSAPLHVWPADEPGSDETCACGAFFLAGAELHQERSR